MKIMTIVILFYFNHLKSLDESIETTTPKFEYGPNVAMKKWNEELHKQFPNLSESEVNLCSKKK